MLALNDAYEKAFLIPNGKTSFDYLGKDDVEVWGKDIGEKYQLHDQKVLQTKKEWRGVEIVRIKDVTIMFDINNVY